jgi:hypothetical protein
MSVREVGYSQAASPPPALAMMCGYGQSVATLPHRRLSLFNRHSRVMYDARLCRARIPLALHLPLPLYSPPTCIIDLPRRWAHLASSIPTLTRYVPPREELASEGPRLVVEQTIASRARVFYGSGRSAVSQLIHRRRQLVRGVQAERLPQYL